MIVVLAAAIADLCGPVPAEAPDPADAASYLEVADQAAAAGEVRVAAIAYRKVLARDPGNAHARAALDELCRSDRASVDDSDELLAAIAQFRAGELDAARDALIAIAGRKSRSESGAHFFLGMIALQRHDGSLAAGELELAARDPAYADVAESMLRLARRTGTVAARLLVAPEYDTNPQLLPDTPPAGATTGPRMADGDLLAAASLAVRPVHWLVLRDVFTVREQFQQHALDFLGNTAQAGLELHDGRNDVEIRYDFDYDLLDRMPYLIASRGTAAVRHELDGLALVASYGLRRRAYQQDTESPFTGWVHAADAGVIVHATTTLDLEARMLVIRELTADPTYADSAFGGTLGVRARLTPRLRLVAGAMGWYSRYDAAEPDGTLREDVHGEAAADLEVDLGDYTIATCGTSAIGNTSTVEDFRYWKLVARCGLALEIGGP